jgi:hypothetical protein
MKTSTGKKWASSPREVEDDDALLQGWLAKSRPRKSPSTRPRPESASPPAPIGDSIADRWFR